jgi:hypothetical protein
VTEEQGVDEYGSDRRARADARRRAWNNGFPQDRGPSYKPVVGNPGSSPEDIVEAQARQRVFKSQASRPFAIMAARRASAEGRPDLFWFYFNEAKALPDLASPSDGHGRSRRGSGRWKGTRF